ncbi:MAG: DUF4386 family protein [Rubrobacteraceae bacterium]
MESKETKQRGLERSVALLLVVEFGLLVVALVVLGSAIGWPASLDEPANVMLPLITEQSGAVLFGYGVYMLYSVLFIPLALLLYYALREVDSPLLTMGVVFGVISGVLRPLGIIRWLSAMPFLAEVYLDPQAGAATRDAVSVFYEGINEFSGAIGEILGVQFSGGLFIGLVSLAMLRSARLPSWMGLSGLGVAALHLAGLLEISGVDTGPLLTLAVTALQFWMLALALVLFFRTRSGRAS